jgi:hypothetical protein
MVTLLQSRDQGSFLPGDEKETTLGPGVSR